MRSPSRGPRYQSGRASATGSPRERDHEAQVEFLRAHGRAAQVGVGEAFARARERRSERAAERRVRAQCTRGSCGRARNVTYTGRGEPGHSGTRSSGGGSASPSASAEPRAARRELARLGVRAVARERTARRQPGALVAGDEGAAPVTRRARRERCGHRASCGRATAGSRRGARARAIIRRLRRAARRLDLDARARRRAPAPRQPARDSVASSYVRFGLLALEPRAQRGADDAHAQPHALREVIAAAAGPCAPRDRRVLADRDVVHGRRVPPALADRARSSPATNIVLATGRCRRRLQLAGLVGSRRARR